MDEKDVFFVPGTGQYVKNYGDVAGVDIWLGHGEISPDATCFIGHSLGAHFLLSTLPDPSKRFIFINPLIKKRNILSLFVRWIRFLLFEGIPMKKLVPVSLWPNNIQTALRLLKTDVLEKLQQIPAENITVIRGMHDAYFCTEEDVALLQERGIDVREVSAGHDWNENINNAVMDILRTK